VCYGGARLPDFSDAAGPRDLIEYGWVATIPTPHPLAYLDPIEDGDLRPRGEDPKGVAIFNHPEALIGADLELQPLVTMFRAGVERGIDPAAYQNMTHFALCAWSIMVAAEDREKIRRMKDHTDGA